MSDSGFNEKTVIGKRPPEGSSRTVSNSITSMLIDKIETVVQEDVGRNIKPLFEAAKGGLSSIAKAIAEADKPRVGIITGFYIPTGNPPSGETDGPLGAAMLIAGLDKAGVECRLMTDKFCEGVCKAALDGANVVATLMDVVSDETSVEKIISRWKQAGITHVLSIERCGRSVDGTYRSMRGVDISSYTEPLDMAFIDEGWCKFAIGDGGNEIGMGSISSEIIANNVSHGDVVACVIPADALIVAGVSNWGSYALLGALVVLRYDWRKGILDILTEKNNKRILEFMVEHGPSVDGVTHKRTLSVDGLPLEKHNAKLSTIRSLVMDHELVPDTVIK
ncbi:MAG: DUF4392 domain-containing protein [Alphaproteobacteria bacterium]|nr:DUF4392 domain-containing protein [Alphaproteobacteria bacterium]